MHQTVNDEPALCGTCLKNPPAFDVTITATDYIPPVDQLVQSLKFGANLALAPLFSAMLADAVLASRPTMRMPSVLTAVPLGQQRLQERGFNQSLEIAKTLSKRLSIRLVPQLAVRTRETSAQALLPPKERRKNVRNAFVIPYDALSSIKDQHIGIVDDVITTGETLHELAATFKRFGAASVTSLVFARTPA